MERCPVCGGTRWRTEVEVLAQMHPEPEAFTFVRCASCGLVFLNPRVAPEGLGAYYGEDYLPYRGTAAWGRFAPIVELGFRRMDRRRVRLVRRSGRIGPGSRVLDLGCGRPTFLEELVRRTGAEGIGVDFTDAGWRDDPDRWTDLDLRVQDASSLSVETPVDVVTMWHYLEHDYAPGATLARVRDVMKEGGDACLVVEVPNHDSWTRRRHGSWWAGYHAPRHTALYTPDTLRRLLEGAGWEVEQILPYGTVDAYLLHWMSRMERRRLDWSAGMAARFPGFLLGRVATFPWFALERFRAMGMMTAVARPAGRRASSTGS
ncbi:MAG TPA: class I SAM-dependent methyltransferase [Longimicrobiales bacterium]|nr:class I SAM-dependent methyltransferase [Longimicrobiales bacterium]